MCEGVGAKGLCEGGECWRVWGPRVGVRGRVLEVVGSKGWCEGESVGGGGTKG